MLIDQEKYMLVRLYTLESTLTTDQWILMKQVFMTDGVNHGQAHIQWSHINGDHLVAYYGKRIVLTSFRRNLDIFRTVEVWVQLLNNYNL